MKRPSPPSASEYSAALQIVKAYDKACHDEETAAWNKQFAAIEDEIARLPTLEPPPDLPIAEWVPEPVARHFRQRYYANLEVVTRLVSDKCMRHFYKEMLHKNGDGYEHPARQRIEGEDADNRQTTAVIVLLDMVVQTAQTAVAPLTKAQAKQRYERSMATARLLLEEMDDPWFDSEILHNAAQSYQEQGLARYRYEMRFATSYKSNDLSHHRTLVLRIADKIRELFGKRGLYGTIANLATAVTNYEITKSTVQTWLAPPIRKKPRKRKRLHTPYGNRRIKR
jgi:hypothetical protein